MGGDFRTERSKITVISEGPQLSLLQPVYSGLEVNTEKSKDLSSKRLLKCSLSRVAGYAQWFAGVSLAT